MSVLDAGCGTGSITHGIAQAVGVNGMVVGVDSNSGLIEHAIAKYRDQANLSFVCRSIFDFTSDRKFDLITAARTLQWLSNPLEAVMKLKSLLKPGGVIAILDYNHERIEWQPSPPASMKYFYDQFLNWRKDAGMNNRVGDDLAAMLVSSGFSSVNAEDASEQYSIDDVDFFETAGIWNKVAETRGVQMVEDGYVSEQERLKAMSDYSGWLDNEGNYMTLYLQAVTGLND